MTRHDTVDLPLSPDAGRQLKAAQRRAWALGDYHRFATATVWPLGQVLVDACRISAGQRVLDVAAGSGNVAIRAAKAGATVVASDLTPEHFEAGRRAARRAGVEVEWVEADAEALPFDDEEFDVVTSCFGAIFAPDHRAVGSELLRVCRPGGTVGLITFVPKGAAGEFFELLAHYLPPLPPDAFPPLLWGDDAHVRTMFGDRVVSLQVTPRQYVERAASAREYCELFEQAFGPIVAIRSALAAEPDRLAAFDRDFRDFVDRANRGAPGSQVEIPYDYLLMVGRRR